MERILNDDEKIRKAEEIYYRRNNRNIAISTKPKKSKKYIKSRIGMQMLIMLNIAVIVFSIQNKDFIFTKEFLNVVNQYNIDISEKVISFLGSIVDDDINNVEKNEIIENNTNIINNTEILENIEENDKVEELSSSINEMNLDINNLKAAYSFQTPLSGIVTSRFGTRESNNKNVEGYHTGTDIAADEGTYIKAAMQGIVTSVSSDGDYGNHLKIRCNNVTTVYAHCLNILVQEGQIVSQGQEIATVGNTGNSTGPHLHFEIRVDDRFVDPAKIIQF